jgi:maltose alpha-D-glucosyltransferase/alpha-amylase
MDRIQRLVRTRRACPELGWGKWRIVDDTPDSVLALIFKWRERKLLTIHSLGEQPCEVRLDLGADAAMLKPLLGSGDDLSARSADEPIRLEEYGFRWFRMRESRR